MEFRYALVITQSAGSVEWRSTHFYRCMLAHKQSVKHHNSAPTCSKKAHPQETHPPHIHYQDGGRRQCAPGPSHQRKSHPSRCFYHSTQPMEDLVPLPQHHNQAAWKKRDDSTMMIPFGAHQPFVDHHNIFLGKGGRLGIHL